MLMSVITLFLGLVLAGALALLTRELHWTDKLVQRLEQYAANERRPQHGRTIHSNYHEEPTEPVLQSLPKRIFDTLNGKR